MSDRVKSWQRRKPKRHKFTQAEHERHQLHKRIAQQGFPEPQDPDSIAP